MTDFDHIRPYHDEEVPAVVSRLVSDPEFVDSIAQFSFPRLNQWFPWLIQPLVKTALARKASQINSVDSLQLEAKKYLSQTIESTTTKLTTSGLDNLRANEPHLFISNHRDIAMDPAFVNYALFTHGRDTLRIAIGDNLLQKPFASDLMRLNKSFIVQRSAKGVREKMAAYLGLSSYIDHSISEGCSIWIAQQEGRAKDGIDQTDPAIIKMLYMCQKKGNVSFSDHMNKLNIVPVAISYEYNPCDEAIAQELHAKATTGEYQKKPGEDIQSIVTGITGQKGHVHVAFGTPVSGELESPELLAQTIDQQMQALYHLHPSNHIATAIRNHDTSNLESQFGGKVQEFTERLNQLDAALRPFMLDLYANPTRHLDND